MRRDIVAEWILGQVMTNDRAAAIIGDFSESNTQAGAFKFWMSVAGLVLASTWSWIVALAIGVYLAGSSVWFLNEIWLGQDLHYGYNPLWSKCFDALAVTATILLVLAPYVAVRYALKDKVTRTTFAFLALVLLTIFFSRQYVVLSLCVVAVVMGLVGSLWTSERRRGLAVVVATAAAGFLSSPLANWLVSLVHHPAFGCELQGCIINTTTPALAVSKLIVAIPIVLLCTFLHARLFESDPRRTQSGERLCA